MDDSPRPLLSVCMIVKNEEATVGRALASAAGMGAELVVVDTGSTDRTVAIAEAAGASVHHFTWINDFSAARNFAFSRARGAWMLVLDADEALLPELCARVARVLLASKASALRIPATSLDDCGRAQMTMMSTRLLRNGHGYAYEGRVHEDVTTSILRAGGTIEDCLELPLVHYGYTAAESGRKNRQARNIELLEAAHRAAPEDPRHWHYLGIENRISGDLSGAAGWFDRVLARAPEHELAAWSASSLAHIHETERDFGAAWEVGKLGLGGKAGRVDALVQLGKLALREGDADSAGWCADELERTPGDDLTDRATSLEHATELRTAAHLEKGATSKARDLLVSGVKEYPRNAVLAELLVKACELLGGRGRGALDAMRRTGNAPTVIAAAMNAAYCGGAYQACVDLGAKSDVGCEMLAFALARLGKLDQARDQLLAFGDRAAAHAVVFGLAHADEAAIAHGLAASAAPHAEAFALVRAGARVPARLLWIITTWLRLASSLREETAAAALARCLPWPAAEREAFRALLAYHEGDEAAALTRAVAHPAELASLEVIGLVAHARGDLPAAATM
ncbi:MAG TPA: glycosyltransferase, partial [Labilithrix sp.]|nr:glycosyltransferase [Labilithrix sp.]